MECSCLLGGGALSLELLESLQALVTLQTDMVDSSQLEAEAIQ